MVFPKNYSTTLDKENVSGRQADKSRAERGIMKRRALPGLLSEYPLLLLMPGSAQQMRSESTCGSCDSLERDLYTLVNRSRSPSKEQSLRVREMVDAKDC